MKAAVRRLRGRHLRGPLIVVLTLVATLSVAALGTLALVAFDRAVAPELGQRTRLIGSIVRAEIQRTVALGIPIDAVSGLERYLAEALESFDEVERISVNDASGQVIATAGQGSEPTLLERAGVWDLVGVRRTPFSLPVIAGNEIVGRVTIESSPLFIDLRLRQIFLDMIVIAVVASILAVELVLALTIGAVGKPLDGVMRLLEEQRSGDFRHSVRERGLSGLRRVAVRLNDHAADLAERLGAGRRGAQARIARAGLRVAAGRPARLGLSDFNDIRLALFLFSVATEIAAAFLPLYARAAERPAWLTAEVAAAAPLALYLVVLAALSPFGDALAARIGPRRLFLISIPPAAASLAVMALADDLLWVTALRGVTAGFYALATIACQQYAIRASAERGSTRPLAAFVAVIYGGVFCGAALGGILAGRLGFGAAFLSGGALALLSGAVAARAMIGRAGDPVGISDPPPDPQRQGGSVFRLTALLVGITVPMNAATAVFIWYLSPLMLAALGQGPAEIARVVMLYYLAQILLGAPVALLADRRHGPTALILAGAGLSGAALLSLLAWGGFWAIAAAVAGLGIGHALMRAPQTALAIALAGSGARLRLVRLLERFGALVGLAASAFWLEEIGAGASLQIIGILVFVGAMLFAMVVLLGRKKCAGRRMREECS